MNEWVAAYSFLNPCAVGGGCASAFAVALACVGRKRAASALPGVSSGRAVAVPDEWRVIYQEVRMKVDPGFVNHPKFLRLKKLVGDFAMEAVIRIWGHCQTGQKGEYWRGADAGYVEAVAMWVGTDGQLYGALKTARIILEEANGIRVNDWAAHNWRIVVNWKLGQKPKSRKGQAKEKPTLKPVESTGPSPLNDRLNDLNDRSTEENNNVASLLPGGGSAEELKTKYAALSSLIEKMEARRNELTDVQLEELRSLKKKRAAVQKAQAA